MGLPRAVVRAGTMSSRRAAIPKGERMANGGSGNEPRNTTGNVVTFRNVAAIRSTAIWVRHQGLEPRTHWLRASCSTA